MTPLAPEHCRALLKIARELVKVPESEIISLALQQYFNVAQLPAISDFFKCIKKLPASDRTPVGDSLSLGQIDSKLWFIEALKGFNLPEGALVFVLGGWNGILPLLMLWTSPEARWKLRSIDIDPEATRRASFLLMFYEMRNEFLAATANMYDLNYSETSFKPHGWNTCVTEAPALIINTACEHIENFEAWWNLVPKGVAVALQNNNFFECAGHVSCVNDLSEFEKLTPLSSVHFSGSLTLEKYDRFMRIGIK